MSQARVFSAYRRLFRARSKLFRGDHTALRESRIAIKNEFLRHKQAETEGPHFEGLLLAVDEAEDMLLHGIVQGKLNDETGNYQVKFEPHHAQSMADSSKVEPVTPDVVARLETPTAESVKVTKSSSSSSNDDSK